MLCFHISKMDMDKWITLHRVVGGVELICKIQSNWIILPGEGKQMKNLSNHRPNKRVMVRFAPVTEINHKSTN